MRKYNVNMQPVYFLWHFVTPTNPPTKCPQGNTIREGLRLAKLSTNFESKITSKYVRKSEPSSLTLYIGQTGAAV